MVKTTQGESALQWCTRALQLAHDNSKYKDGKHINTKRAIKSTDKNKGALRHKGHK